MISSLKLTVLVDDEAGSGPARAEHGFSVWLEADHFRILFDTGPGAGIAENARQLGINLAEADAIVVSHGHDDHVGGISGGLVECGKAHLFMHPGALRQRYSRARDGAVRPAGFPVGAGEQFARHKECVIWTEGVTRLLPAVFATGEIPRQKPPEAPGARFFLDPACTIPDELSDDQALVVDTALGAVVVLGCSHAGVANTLTYALAHSRSAKLRAVVGGMHLLEASPEALEGLCDSLEKLGAEIICPCHCTGAAASDYLAHRFPKAYVRGRIGTALELNS